MGRGEEGGEGEEGGGGEETGRSGSETQRGI